MNLNIRPTRRTTLAALVFVAIAAPVTAYAVSAGDDPTPPGHSHGHGHGHGHDAKHDKDTGDQGKDKAGKPDHSTGGDHADDSSAAGRAHAEAMKRWAQCVGEAASGEKADAGPPKDACGDKPVGPGRAKHSSGDAPGHSGDHGRAGR